MKRLNRNLFIFVGDMPTAVWWIIPKAWPVRMTIWIFITKPHWAGWISKHIDISFNFSLVQAQYYIVDELIWLQCQFSVWCNIQTSNKTYSISITHLTQHILNTKDHPSFFLSKEQTSLLAITSVQGRWKQVQHAEWFFRALNKKLKLKMT